MWEYRATIDRVVDGDTVDMTVNLGFRTYRKDRFRLYGIDTPERGQTGWAEATDALQAMIAPGSCVRIETHHPMERDAADKYGRWLATVFAVAADGAETNVNTAMVEGGFAKVYLL